ncbi:MAG: molecular chaperone DnaJ [Frankiaceae bacterium]|nr:molecular chaperone DnaJ [Frankiaceae bacterium]
MSARDLVEKDYYAALGVPKNATQAEIKKAYRKLARELHPDKNKGDKEAEERFKAVSEAYAILSDDEKRAEYDEARELFANGGFRPGAGGGPGGFTGNVDFGDLFGGAGGAGSFGDLFGDIFGNGNGMGGAGRAGGGPRTRPRRGGDLETEVTLDFAEAVRGVTVPLRLGTPHTCRNCGGSGARPGTTPRTCPTCGGSGSVSVNQGPFSISQPCRDCRGRGRIIDDPCPECRGTGVTTGERTLNVRIPAGVNDGQRIRLKGKGTPGEGGAPAGDLYVVVHVTPHRFFRRKGDNLTLTLPVTFPEAALGAEVPVPTLDGVVTLRVPAGTASGRTFRVKGRGVVRANGKAGDLLVTIEIHVPKKLSKKAREAVETLAAEDPTDPRAHLLEEAVTRV